MLQRSCRRLHVVDGDTVAHGRNEGVEVSLYRVIDQRQELPVAANLRQLADQQLLQGARNLRPLVVQLADDQRCRLGDKRLVLSAFLSHETTLWRGYAELHGMRTLSTEAKDVSKAGRKLVA